MAELDYDHFDGGYPAVGSGHRFGRYAHLGGAVLSVALVISGAVWAYQLAVRDVAGVPVIRAVVDPMRLAPSNPGGSQTLHQGLSVNAVAAAGTALPLPESLTLAPRPMELADEDQAGLEPLEPVGGADVVAMAPVLAPVEPLSTQIETDATEAFPATQEDAVAAALAEALGLESPDSLVSDAAVDVPTEMAAVVVSGAEIDPATLVPGALLVQLGAFDNQDEARQEWLRLTGNFTDLMGGKSLVIQPAQSGGKTFFRLRAHGFVTDDDTRRFCTAMVVEKATCIPVVQR
jgi:hypothetical protein